MAPPRAALVVDIDALVKRNPYKHRKAWLHHVELQQLSLVVVKNVVVQGIKVLAADTQPAIPTDDARELATFLWDHLKWPVAKDLLISSVARVYEHAFIVYYAPDDLVAARVVRDVSADAREAYALASARGSSSLADDLRARVAVARMVMSRMPYPVAVANAAVLTVEEVWLVAGFAYRRHRVLRAHDVLAAPTSSPDAVLQAHRDLVEYEDEGSLFYDSLDLATRTGGAVVSETFGAALGTLVWPGFGTTVVGLLCGAICWVV